MLPVVGQALIEIEDVASARVLSKEPRKSTSNKGKPIHVKAGELFVFNGSKVRLSSLLLLLFLLSFEFRVLRFVFWFFAVLPHQRLDDGELAKVRLPSCCCCCCCCCVRDF